MKSLKSFKLFFIFFIVKLFKVDSVYLPECYYDSSIESFESLSLDDSISTDLLFPIETLEINNDVNNNDIFNQIQLNTKYKRNFDNSKCLPQIDLLDLDDHHKDKSFLRNNNDQFNTAKKITVPLIFNKDYPTFTAKITIANQNFNVLLDTGSSYFFVSGLNCTTVSLNDLSCTSHKNKFKRNPKKIPNFSGEFEFHYGFGEIKGELELENVTIGGITAKNMVIGISDYETGITKFNCDGILGLGLGLDQRTINYQNNFLDLIFKQEKNLYPRFSFYLPTNDDEQKGKMIIGGIPDEYDEDKIEFIEVFPDVNGHWIVNLDDVSYTTEVNKELVKIGFSGRKVAFDTGTAVIDLTPEDAYTLNSKIPGFRKISNFEYNNIYVFPLTSEDLAIDPIPGSDYCISPLTGRNAIGNVWIFGIYFLRKFISVFDLKNNE
ncbi:hypothetical protein G9A89_001817 [Geosiphon pyriformis]|nr:hypothetical protein G9A89_001817 [Geosiphon pyriformis]